MARDCGQVVDVEAQYAIVLLRREQDGPCAVCPGSDLCSTIPPEECERKVRALNRLGAGPGDIVGLRLADEGQLGLAFVHAFGPPLVAALVGLITASWLAAAAGLQGTALSLAGALGLLGALLAWIPVSRFLDRIRKDSRMFLPVVEEYRVEERPG